VLFFGQAWLDIFRPMLFDDIDKGFSGDVTMDIFQSTSARIFSANVDQ